MLVLYEYFVRVLSLSSCLHASDVHFIQRVSTEVPVQQAFAMEHCERAEQHLAAELQYTMGVGRYGLMYWCPPSKVTEAS